MATYEALPERMEQIANELKRRDGVSKRALSLAADQSKEFVNTIINGRSKDPGAISLAMMCEKFGYNVRWLLTGLGPKIVDRGADAHAARERGDAEPAEQEPTARKSLSLEKPVLRGTQAIRPTKRAPG